MQEVNTTEIVGKTIEDSVQKHIAHVHGGQIPLDFGPLVFPRPSPPPIPRREVTPPPIPDKARRKAIPPPVPKEAKRSAIPPPIPLHLRKTLLFDLPHDSIDIQIVTSPPPIPDAAKKVAVEKTIRHQSKIVAVSQPPIEVGMRLKGSMGTYRLEEKLPGRNPVFLARQEDSGIHVIVKGYADEVDPYGFDRDSVTLKFFSGDEPNLLTVRESIEDETGRYNVFRYIDGMDLKLFFKLYGPLDERELFTIFPPLLEALALVHKKGIIHRDIKAANIMIGRRDKMPIEKNDLFPCAGDVDTHLFDFDMCYERTLERFEHHGKVLGTFGYMAPEIWKGQAKDPRSDLYAMGVVLYSALTRRLPFSLPSKDLSDIEYVSAIAHKHLNHDIPDPRQFNPTISSNMRDVIQKALAKRPEDRYQSARDMKSDILMVVY